MLLLAKLEVPQAAQSQSPAATAWLSRLVLPCRATLPMHARACRNGLHVMRSTRQHTARQAAKSNLCKVVLGGCPFSSSLCRLAQLASNSGMSSQQQCHAAHLACVQSLAGCLRCCCGSSCLQSFQRSYPACRCCWRSCPASRRRLRSCHRSHPSGCAPCSPHLQACRPNLTV